MRIARRNGAAGPLRSQVRLGNCRVIRDYPLPDVGHRTNIVSGRSTCEVNHTHNVTGRCVLSHRSVRQTTTPSPFSNRRLKADGAGLGVQGEFGIGLLSFWTVGDTLTKRARDPRFCFSSCNSLWPKLGFALVRLRTVPKLRSPEGRVEGLGIHELGERHVGCGDSPVGFLSSYGVSMEGCRLEAHRASFFSCAGRNRSSTDVVLSGEGFPNRFRYRCPIYALRGIFHSSCS